MSATMTRDQRPCDNCRRRKIRCLFASENAVNCVLCLSRTTECTYVQEAPQRKRPHATADPETRQNSSKPSQRSKISHDATVLRDYSKLKGKTLLRETLGHQNRQSNTVIGETSDFDLAIVSLLPHDSKGECLAIKEPPFLRRPCKTIYFRMRHDTQEEMDQELRDLDEIESVVAPYGPELVNLYFRIVHPSFPVLNKQVFLEKHGRNYRESTPTGLGAVYLLALNWWSYSSVLSSKPKPDAKKLEKLVLRMLFDVHQRPKISDLQGGLVLLQQPAVNSWALTGHLVAMSQNLGINLDCSDWRVPEWERNVRKRVAWGIFMQDKWGALVYGRPSNIRMDDWEVLPLDVSDFPETSKDDDDEEGSADIEKGRETFLQMVSLTQIVAEILDQFFTRKAIRRQDSLPKVLERAKRIQLRLKDWFSNLPPSLSIDDTKPRRLSSVGYLHLAYYTAEITLHRAILRSHAQTDPNTDLIIMTRRAAETRFTSALEFVKRLKQEHLQSFWYFSSTISLTIIGIFAGILAVTSQDIEKQKSYMALAAEYSWILRINSVGAEFMKYGVATLDISRQLLEQQFEANSRSTPAHLRIQREAQRTPQDDETSPYSVGSDLSPEDPRWMELGAFDSLEYESMLETMQVNTYAMDDWFSFDNTGL